MCYPGSGWQINKQRILLPSNSGKRFKARGLSDATLLNKHTRLGFGLSTAVSPPNKALPLTRYPAASPVPPALPLPRFLAARSSAESASHCFLSFRGLPAAIGSGFFYPRTSPTKYRFQQSRAVKSISSQGRIKQDFLFTPSESIAPVLPPQILVIGPGENKIETNSIPLSIKKGEQ
jgi:hypothetical protein